MESKYRRLAPPGGDYITRRMERLEREISAVRTARRLEAATIGRGGISIEDGGGITVQDGGGVTVLDGGALTATHPNGQDAAYFGGLRDGSGATWGRGLLVMRADGRSTFWAGEKTDGSFEVVLGTDASPTSFLGGTSAGWVDLKGAYAKLRGESGLFLETGSGGQVQIGLGATNVFLGHATTGAAANCLLTDTGAVYRSTSSRRYKNDIRDARIDPDAVLRLRGRTWTAKPHEGDEYDPTKGRRLVGFIAEELDDLGLTDFVLYDDEDRPDAIQYDRLSVALLAVLQRQEKTIETLAARVEALEAPDARGASPDTEEA